MKLNQLGRNYFSSCEAILFHVDILLTGKEKAAWLPLTGTVIFV